MKKSLNIYLFLALVIIDVVCYHFLHEVWGFNFFWETEIWGHTTYPLYRIFQGALDVTALYLIYRYRTAYQLGGFLIAKYLMTGEALYYLFIGDLFDLTVWNGQSLYWLERFYFSGWWLFNDGFDLTKFILSGAIGLIFLIISNFTRTINENKFWYER